jgi:hypothetical protein
VRRGDSHEPRPKEGAATPGVGKQTTRDYGTGFDVMIHADKKFPVAINGRGIITGGRTEISTLRVMDRRCRKDREKMHVCVNQHAQPHSVSM